MQKNDPGIMDFSVNQLPALTNAVHDRSKVAAGQELTLQEELFELEDLLYKSVQLLVFGKSNKQVKLHVDISCGLPLHVFGDARCLTRIINNLLSNAMKFTPQGNVIIKVRELERSADQIILDFSVSDEGIGMTQEQLDEAFQPFMQADSRVQDQHEGRVGLAISQRLCRLMGGNLGVETVPGQGSIFSFRVPFKIAPEAEASMPPPTPVIDCHAKSVLIVTDCPVCSDILQRMLMAMHFKVQAIRSATGAVKFLDHAQNQERPYELLLLGQSLDDMSGVEFAGQLKQINRLETKCIMLVDPSEMVAVSQQAEVLGLTGIISTPVRPADLSTAIMAAFTYQEVRQIDHSMLEPLYYWPQAKVLLVDDNNLGREVTRALLQNAGIQVTEAEDGDEAVKKVIDQDFDLVLMDIQMPVMDGLSAARAIRQLDKKNVGQLPIIAMTAHAITERWEEVLAAGLNGHIGKPTEIQALYTELNRWLPQEHQRRPAKTQVTLEPTAHVDLEALLPDVDVVAGVRRMAGDRQAYLGLLKKFADQYTEMESTLREELDSGQIKAAILRVHSLRGVAGNLGATRLCELAARLEGQLKAEEELSAVEAMLKALQQLLATLKNVQKLVQCDSEQKKPAGSERELQGLLHQLLEPLQKLQIQDVKLLMIQLQEVFWPEAYREAVSGVLKCIECYQLSQAAEKVQKLLEKSEK